jgi:hypothetical protein
MRDEVLGTLKETWGGRFAENLSELKGFISDLPDEVSNAIQNARLSDGRLLVNVGGFADAMLSLAKSGARSAPTAKERLETISETLKESPHRYFRDGLDKEAVSLRRQLETGSEETEAASSRNPQAAQINRQLAAIKEVLATDPRRYWKEDLGSKAIGLRRQLDQVKATAASRGR